MLELLARSDANFAGRCAVIVVAEGLTAAKRETLVQRIAPAQVEFTPDLSSAEARLSAILTSSTMGLRLYATGTEPLIGTVVRIAAEHHIDARSVQTEHRGSLKRRVQCVHCKGMTEDVTTNPVECAHCGLLLLVRDHYSRRLAAFQGVCINAEDPADRPEPKVEFL